MPRPVAILNRHPRLRIDRRGLRAAVALLDRAAARFHGGCPPGELSLVFLTDPALARIHADFMGDPSPTDVITFSGDQTAGQAGEICISADTAARHVGFQPAARAAAGSRHGQSAERKFSAELTLYLVHGWLHLAGYDDLQPAKKRRMRAAERRALALLHAAGGLPACGFR